MNDTTQQATDHRELMRRAAEEFRTARAAALDMMANAEEREAASYAMDVVIGGHSCRSRFLQRIDDSARSLFRMGMHLRPCHFREVATEAKLAVLECIVTDQRARQALAR